MGVLTIDGQDFSVPDSFGDLPHDQQLQVISGIRQKHNLSDDDRGGTQSDAPQHPVFDAARSFVQGFPLVGGFQPKIEAAADAGLSYLTGGATPEAGTLSGGIGDRYQQALGNISSDQQQFAQAHPALNTGAQIAGGIASTAPLASIAIPSKLAQASGALATAGRVGFTGLEGAALGGTDAYARGDNVAQGTVMGAAGGAGGQALGEALSGGSNLVRALMRGSEGRATDRAAAIIRQLGESDALSPTAAQAELARLGPDATLADLGANMQQGARAVASAPGSGQVQLVEALTGRAKSAGSRIAGAMDAALGPRTNILDSADQIAASRSAAARPLYEQAYASDVPMSDELKSLLARPSMERAFAGAQKLAADAGHEIDPEKPTVMALDYTKRALDDSISSNLRDGNNNEARILMENRNTLLEHMDKAVPEYAQARKVFSDYSSVANALQEGQKVFSNATTPDMLDRSLANMSDAEKQAFTEGARQQIAQTMGTARNDANAAKALLDKGYNREKMALILGDDAASGLNNAVDAERTFAATMQAARGGSMTDRNILAQQIIPGDQKTPVLRSLLNLRFGDAALGIGERLASGAINARNERTRDAIARALLSRDASVFAPVAPTQSQISPNIAAALIGAGLPAERN
ncbi:hypothetical protein [Acetobacter orientalis]|uniref:hypothetical protein n=1 Tax=Acetobacter orientalis TaxID=146474 RepID=UPI00241C3604|nr:hypothetical protein [Acetobacter orientalis]